MMSPQERWKRSGYDPAWEPDEGEQEGWEEAELDRQERLADEIYTEEHYGK